MNLCLQCHYFCLSFLPFILFMFECVRLEGHISPLISRFKVRNPREHKIINTRTKKRNRKGNTSINQKINVLLLRLIRKSVRSSSVIRHPSTVIRHPSSVIRVYDGAVSSLHSSGRLQREEKRDENQHQGAATVGRKPDLDLHEAGAS